MEKFCYQTQQFLSVGLGMDVCTVSWFASSGAPQFRGAAAIDYVGVHETLLLFTGIRHYWENQRDVLKNALFVKDGPLSIRAQYSKLVNPIRRFLVTAQKQGIDVCLVGQEKSGAFWDHLQLIGDEAPTSSFFIPDHTYIRRRNSGQSEPQMHISEATGCCVFPQFEIIHR